MKNLYFLLSVMFLFCCSASDDCSFDKSISFFYGGTMKICDDMIQHELQGIDSEVGKILKVDSSLVINYDIGGLAGLYVNESESKEIDQSINQEFWYTTRNNTLYITFPFLSSDTIILNSGFNFLSTDLDEKDVILDIMRTFEY